MQLEQLFHEIHSHIKRQTRTSQLLQSPVHFYEHVALITICVHKLQAGKQEQKREKFEALVPHRGRGAI